MKLGLIVPGGFDPGGRERVIPSLVALAGALGARHEVHVFSTDGDAGSTERFPSPGGVRVHRLPALSPPGSGGAIARGLGRARRGLGLARLGWRLGREIEGAADVAPFDLLHAFWAAETGLLAALVGRRLRLPVVVSVGGGEAVWLPEIGYGGAGSVAGRARVRAALALAGAVTAGSDFARARLPAAAAARARVVPLGVACDRFAAPAARPAGPPWRLLHVASLNRVKDQETLLRAFAAVVARLAPADVHLDCIGEDTLGGEVQRRAQALGLGDRVRFHGFVSPEALPPFFRDAHLHLLSSRYESQGVAILEAAAAGLATVGTAVGLLPSLAPAAARAVPPGDAGALADAVVALLADQPARLAAGEAAQRFARAHDVAWTAAAFEDIYRSLVAGGAAPGPASPAGTSVMAPSGQATTHRPQA